MINLDWATETSNLVIWSFTGPWTFDEFRTAQKQTYTLIDSVEGYVDGLFLTSPEQFIPLRAITNLRSIVANRHPRQRYAVIVGAQTHLVTLMTSLTELVPGFGAYLQFARTEAEGYILIAKLRAKANPVAP